MWGGGNLGPLLLPIGDFLLGQALALVFIVLPYLNGLVGHIYRPVRLIPQGVEEGDRHPVIHQKAVEQDKGGRPEARFSVIFVHLPHFQGRLIVQQSPRVLLGKAALQLDGLIAGDGFVDKGSVLLHIGHLLLYPKSAHIETDGNPHHENQKEEHIGP